MRTILEVLLLTLAVEHLLCTRRSTWHVLISYHSHPGDKLLMLLPHFTAEKMKVESLRGPRDKPSQRSLWDLISGPSPSDSSYDLLMCSPSARLLPGALRVRSFI